MKKRIMSLLIALILIVASLISIISGSIGGSDKQIEIKQSNLGYNYILFTTYPTQSTAPVQAFCEGWNIYYGSYHVLVGTQPSYQFVSSKTYTIALSKGYKGTPTPTPIYYGDFRNNILVDSVEDAVIRKYGKDSAAHTYFKRLMKGDIEGKIKGDARIRKYDYNDTTKAYTPTSQTADTLSAAKALAQWSNPNMFDSYYGYEVPVSPEPGDIIYRYYKGTMASTPYEEMKGNLTSNGTSYQIHVPSSHPTDPSFNKYMADSSNFSGGGYAQQKIPSSAFTILKFNQDLIVNIVYAKPAKVTYGFYKDSFSNPAHIVEGGAVPDKGRDFNVTIPTAHPLDGSYTNFDKANSYFIGAGYSTRTSPIPASINIKDDTKDLNIYVLYKKPSEKVEVYYEYYLNDNAVAEPEFKQLMDKNQSFSVHYPSVTYQGQIYTADKVFVNSQTDSVERTFTSASHTAEGSSMVFRFKRTVSKDIKIYYLLQENGVEKHSFVFKTVKAGESFNVDYPSVSYEGMVWNAVGFSTPWHIAGENDMVFVYDRTAGGGTGPTPTPGDGKGSIIVSHVFVGNGSILDVDNIEGVEPGEHVVSAKDYPEYKVLGESQKTVTITPEVPYAAETFFYDLLNHPPTAYVSVPREMMMGDDFNVAAVCADPDGDELTYSWDVSLGGMNGTLGLFGGDVWFSQPGVATFTITVSDGQATATASDTILIREPIPNARLTHTGTYKENRRVTLDTSTSISGSRRYGMDWDRTEWEITPLSGGTAGDIRVVESMTGSQELNVLFKRAGTYKAKVTVYNTAGYSSSNEVNLTIAPDLIPIANFGVPQTLFRDPEDNNHATIEVFDTSVSNDNDPIVKRVWLYCFDENNDGFFNFYGINNNPTEFWYVYRNGGWHKLAHAGTGLPMTLSEIRSTIDIDLIADGNIQNPKVRTNKVGRYKFEVMVKEEFGQPTIPQFVTSEDRRRDETFTKKAAASKIAEVRNVAPAVTLSTKVHSKKKVNITVLTDYTGIKLTELLTKLNETKAALIGVNAEADIHVINDAVQIGTQAVVESETITRTITSTNTSGYFSNSYYYNDGTYAGTLSMSGTMTSYVDSYWVPPFSYPVGTTLTGNSPSFPSSVVVDGATCYPSGSMTSTPSTVPGGSKYVTDSISEGLGAHMSPPSWSPPPSMSYNDGTYSGTLSLLSSSVRSFDPAPGGGYWYGGTASYGGTVTSAPVTTYTYSQSYSGTKTIPGYWDSTTYYNQDYTGSVTRYYTVHYPYHSIDCAKLTQSGLKAEEDNYVLMISDGFTTNVKDGFGTYYGFGSLTKKIAEYVTTRNASVYAITPSSILDMRINNNYSINSTLQNITLRQFVNASPMENKLYTTGQWGLALDEILNKYALISAANSQYVLVDEDTVEYKTEFIDNEDDPMIAERWKFIHDPNHFDNSNGLYNLSDVWQGSPVTRFSKVGRYEVIYQAKDSPTDDNRFDNYRLWSNEAKMNLYVHRKAVARFNLSVSPDGHGYTISAYDFGSYDLDHNLSRADKGIVEFEWKWRTTDETTWRNERINQTGLDASKTYIIRLRVRDIEGVWSDPVVKMVDRAFPPVALFTIDKNPITHEEPLKVRDQSYANLDSINRWHWIIVRQSNGAVVQNAQFTNSNTGTGAMAGFDVNVKNVFTLAEIGQYRLYLRVRSTSGLWSDGGTDSVHNLSSCYYQDFVVEEPFKLENFRVVMVRDVKLESYYYNAATGKYVDKPIYVRNMAVDGSNFGGAAEGLTKGYSFEFEIDSTNFNDENDVIEIEPRFFTCDSFTRSASETDVYWQDSKHSFFKAGEGEHRKMNKILLTKVERVKKDHNTATWRGSYYLPGTSFAVPKGSTVEEARRLWRSGTYTKRDILVNFNIKGLKEGQVKYDYNLKQWSVERTSVKGIYGLGDVIRYDWRKSCLDDKTTKMNR